MSDWCGWESLWYFKNCIYEAEWVSDFYQSLKNYLSLNQKYIVRAVYIYIYIYDCESGLNLSDLLFLLYN